jgi:hypothetical protein
MTAGPCVSLRKIASIKIEQGSSQRHCRGNAAII